MLEKDRMCRGELTELSSTDGVDICFSDLMAFPVSLPDDGLIDITFASNVCPSLSIPLSTKIIADTLLPQSSRSVMIELMDGAKHGANFWHPKVEFHLTCVGLN